MGNEAALRSSMVGLAVVMIVVWLWTQSLKKSIVTYVVGVVLIGGVILPDWDFFDRPFSRWRYPVTAEERAAAVAEKSGLARFGTNPWRIIAYSLIYGFAVSKWWMFVST